MMVKLAAGLVPVTLVTVTLATPTLAISAAGTVAVILVALVVVEVIWFPLKFTTEVEVKLVPLMVSVKALPKARVVVGLKAVMVGAGGLTAKGTPEETPALVVTVMLGVAMEVSRLAGTAAVSCVELR